MSVVDSRLLKLCHCCDGRVNGEEVEQLFHSLFGQVKLSLLGLLLSVCSAHVFLYHCYLLRLSGSNIQLLSTRWQNRILATPSAFR